MNAKSSAIPFMKSAALWYVRQGFRIFPLYGIQNGRCLCGKEKCKSPGKHPIIADWSAAASNDVAVVDEWWSDWPKANIGLPTGSINGISVLDFDVKSGGDVAFDDFNDRFPEFKKTWLVMTGGGGWHVFFKNAGIGNSVSALAKGVDTRGEGGYVVAAPSAHISGRSYEWEESSRPGGEDLATMPAELVALIPKHKPSINKGESVRTEPLPEGKLLDLAAALEFISSDNRETWVLVGMAIHNESDHESSFGVWDQWSQKSSKYDFTDCQRVWASFRQSDNGVKLGTVFSMAKAAGYRRMRSVEVEDISKPRHWRSELLEDKGKILNRLHNYALFLQYDDRFAGTLRHDKFADCVMYCGKELQDSHISIIRAELEPLFPDKVAASDVFDAIGMVARKNSYHPIRDYLDGLVWDGKERIKHFYSDYCLTPNDPYHQGAAIAHFVSAVLRIYNPGCKVDLMTVLESKQGLKKSTLWHSLYSPWYREVSESLSNKDFFVGLRGTWCADFGEMEQIKRADAERYKQIITMREDTYRPPYGRCTVKYPRECIFVGGTNQDRWLTDNTGGRRFLPVHIHFEIDVDGVMESRDQLFAEAMVLASKNIEWWSVPDAESHQELRLTSDAWRDLIETWLAVNPHEFSFHQTVGKWIDVNTILERCLDIHKQDWTPTVQLRVANCLKQLKFKPAQIWQNGKKNNGWIAEKS